MSVPATTSTPTSPVDSVGADIVMRVLEAEGVEVCFGMPGGAILPIYDAIARGTSVRHVLVRHEQGAGHMAQGYARASGRPGVVLATSGPGATNLVTPIADAQMDSTPMVCITGQVRSNLLGSDAFQECDITGITAPIVKHSWLVQDVLELEGILHAAFDVARSGRPGPVLVDIPRDIQATPVAQSSHRLTLPGLVSTPSPDRGAVSAALRALDEAERPVLYVGGGAQGASKAVLALSERGAIPVVATLLGKGAFPESHALFVGVPGMHGSRAANHALHHADLIIAAGARFDDRVTGNLETFAPHARVVHIDVDAYEHNKVRRADIAMHGRLADVADALVVGMSSPYGTRASWLRQLAEWTMAYPYRYADDGRLLKPQGVMERLNEALRGRDDVVWTTGVGQHQMWAMQYATVDRPRSFITSGGLGTMGFGLPAAIGARAARPDATVVCVDGDGSFQMTLQELGTAVSAELPVIVVVLNNGHLGMVHQWQSMFYAERLSEIQVSPDTLSLATIARGFGALGFDVHDVAEFDAALSDALASGRTAVLDVRVDPSESCFPMILPGGAAVDQVEGRDATP